MSLLFSVLLLTSGQFTSDAQAKSKSKGINDPLQYIILGSWKTGFHESAVNFMKEREGFAARLIKVKNPNVDKNPKLLDINNPDEKKRSRQLMGAPIVWDLKYKGKGKWEDGKIYDPTSGETYSVDMQAKSGKELEVRVYWGFPLIGKTMTWERLGRGELFGRPGSPKQQVKASFKSN